MPPPRKRLDEIESWSSASTVSAPKRILSAGRAGFEADPLMNSHCFSWQNASLKEPDEDNKRYPGECQLLWNVVASSDDHELQLDDD